MNKYSEICLILIMLLAVKGQFPEFNVTYTDMERHMRDFTVAQSLLLLTNDTDVKVMAKKLVELMNIKYGSGWFSLVGTDSAINGFKTETNTTIEFQYETTSVTLSQQKFEPCNRSSLVRIARYIDPIIKYREFPL